jgi:hypothetical protein
MCVAFLAPVATAERAVAVDEVEDEVEDAVDVDVEAEDEADEEADEEDMDMEETDEEDEEEADEEVEEESEDEAFLEEESEEEEPSIVDKVKDIVAPARNTNGQFQKDHHSRHQDRGQTGQFAKNGGNPNQPRSVTGKFEKGGPHLLSPRDAKGKFANFGAWLFQQRNQLGQFAPQKHGSAAAAEKGYEAAQAWIFRLLKRYNQVGGDIKKKTEIAKLARQCSAYAAQLLRKCNKKPEFVNLGGHRDFKFPCPAGSKCGQNGVGKDPATTKKKF